MAGVYGGLVAKKPDGEPATFEQAMAELEAIVERIEGGEVGLEKSLAEYERGVALVKHCREMLTRAQQRVEELSKEALLSPEGPGGVGSDTGDDDRDEPPL